MEKNKEEEGDEEERYDTLNHIFTKHTRLYCILYLFWSKVKAIP